MPMIGYLDSTVPVVASYHVAAFRQDLSAARLLEGRNVASQYRWADVQMDPIPALAADLVRRNPDIGAATGPFSRYLPHGPGI